MTTTKTKTVDEQLAAARAETLRLEAEAKVAADARRQREHDAAREWHRVLLADARGPLRNAKDTTDAAFIAAVRAVADGTGDGATVVETYIARRLAWVKWADQAKYAEHAWARFEPAQRAMLQVSPHDTARTLSDAVGDVLALIERETLADQTLDRERSLWATMQAAGEQS